MGKTSCEERERKVKEGMKFLEQEKKKIDASEDVCDSDMT
jgi:hypothetical protein